MFRELKKLLIIMINISKGKSLCRILQNIECGYYSLSGNIIEFGAAPNSKKNFSNLLTKKKNNIHYADKFIKKKGVINVDLNKKTSLKKNFYNSVIFFNVMEHLININNSKIEITRILKKKGLLIGSTPFLYRFHGAPSDYYRFTKPFFEEFFKKEFKIIKICNLGFGPMTCCFSMIFDITKKIPFINNLLFLTAYLIDLILGFFSKNRLKEIYPIAIFFILKKK